MGANPALKGVSAIVRSHHERVDGDGYPDRLVGAAIPISARVVAVCDAYDAMAHDRPYRDGIGSEVAVAVLREHAGSQWDPEVVEIFIGLVEAERVRTAPTTLDHLGRTTPAERRRVEADDGACGCLDALPGEVADQVLTRVE